MRTSQKLTVAGMAFLILTFVFAFINGLAAFISFVLFLLSLVGAWISTVPERGGIMAWLHRRKEEQEDYDAKVRHNRQVQAEGYYRRKGELDAEDRNRRRGF